MTDKKMLKTVQKMAEEDHSSYDCFICVILSYGEHNNAVFGTNGMPLKIRSLTSAFKKRHCPSLDGKPKLFFVEACQASYTDQGEEDQEHVVEVISGAGVARNTRVGESVPMPIVGRESIADRKRERKSERERERERERCL